MEPRRISTVAWGLPEDWIHWTHGDLAQAAANAAALGDDTSTTEAVVAAVRAFDSAIDKEFPGTTFAGIWAPVPGYRRPLATATLRIAYAPESGRMDLETLLTFVRNEVGRSRGTRLLDVAALPSRVLAGEAVLRIVDTTPRFRRQVNREWTWFILPPGTDRTVACHISSDSIAHFDQLADMSTDIANAVEVTLESP
ncbi:hypothetical protein [Cellulomonas wangsupingiae]|uniref:Uncharacterized protein n=1 Tax=Cellulomonas wangsupingiae TaxID=2968085 RepID=A0ABY5K8X8_9CELL|nr:hypothetical protein [Cellulomonas wangsupingiae]MCC2333600.1 hypothetical protein [Cellulomonas wangsupingiae]UUI64868.1 hypothetical protein NP075_17420 [Cellulomonas wangsupingiae]